MQGWSMRIFCPWGPVFLLVGRSENEENVGPFRVHSLKFITVVPKIGFETKMWDVGCDRMVFAINSDLFLIKSDSFFDKWSLDHGQKTINPLNLFRVPVEDT